MTSQFRCYRTTNATMSFHAVSIINYFIENRVLAQLQVSLNEKPCSICDFSLPFELDSLTICTIIPAKLWKYTLPDFSRMHSSHQRSGASINLNLKTNLNTEPEISIIPWNDSSTSEILDPLALFLLCFYGTNKLDARVKSKMQRWIIIKVFSLV